VFRNAAIAALVLGLSVCATALPAVADSNSLTIGGSTALLPLAKDAAGEYQKAHSEVSITVNGGGSGSGLSGAANKSLDIGDSDILAGPNFPMLVDNKVAVIGFGIITNPDVGITGLKKSQVHDIFAGKVTNWKQVGGPDQTIVVVNRAVGSGTRVVFEKTFMGADKPIEGVSLPSSGTVAQFVVQTPYSISYDAFSGTKGQPITELAIDGVAATDDNILTGKYPFWSYEHMFTVGPAGGLAKTFIDYVRGDTATIHNDHFIKLGDMKVPMQNDR
jgi:phosphate transport system substrate-binding protein